ncbi:glycosyltransferase [Bacteroidetes/Chlorobi group bacterium ChocPot_Mid]|nr:MAG: glycosyltransferase [Bacteroidetes/Chlorobi group bacterium ChocPot_Mid]
MIISGFTFVKNAMVFGYPIVESINSLLPLCDELIVAVGKSDDNTTEVINNIQNSKIKIIETEWDPNLKKDGLIYSQQTNLALQHCKGDWCIYLQADEVFHENDQKMTFDKIEFANSNKEIDALLFKYLHFYGSYDYVGVGRQWYRREIRAFRNTGKVISWGDAQGFRKKTDKGIQLLTALQTDIRVYHYGWVRPPKAQYKKIRNSHNYYKEHVNLSLNELEELDFGYSSAYELTPFQGNHPTYMKEKIERDKIWTVNFDPKKLKPKPFLVKLCDNIEKKTGYRIGEFKDFKEVKIKS